MQNEIDTNLPQTLTRQKRGIITVLVSGSRGVAYGVISSFLHSRRHKALHKAVKAMDSRTTIQHKVLRNLEDSMVMWGIYDAETLEQLINTVHCLYNFMSPNEKLFAGELGMVIFQPIYANIQSIQHYSINTLLYLRIIKEKYVLMYKEFTM